MPRIFNIWILPLLLIFTMPCALASPLQAPAIIKTRLDQQLEINRRRYGLVSQTVWVLKNGKPYYRGLNGKANIELDVAVQDNAVYPVYSLAKLFANIVLMKLVEDGLINLDGRLGEYLPELPKSWHGLTVRQCQNHVSGLPEYFSMNLVKTGFLPNKNAIFQALSDRPFEFKTGQAERYNNTNYLIIAAIIEKQSKRQYLELVNDLIIEPLELTNTTFAEARAVLPNRVSSYWGEKGAYLVDKGVDWPEYTFVHSGLHSTAEDLARFMSGIVQGRVLAKATVANMWQVPRLSNGAAGSYASGWEYSGYDKLKQVSHEGGNRVRLSYFYSETEPRDTYTVVYLTNGNRLNTWTSLLVESVVSNIDPEHFPLAYASYLMVEKVMSQASINELETFSEVISKNPFVANYGLEKFIKMRAYGMLYSKGEAFSAPLFELKQRLFPSKQNEP